MKKLIILAATLVISSFLIIAASPGRALAATAQDCSTSSKSFLGMPTWYEYLKPTYQPASDSCEITFKFPDDVGKVALAVVEIMLRIAAMVAVGFVIYGGFRFILSQGEPEQANAARSTIINALVGLAIAVSATVIVSFLFSSLARY